MPRNRIHLSACLRFCAIYFVLTILRSASASVQTTVKDLQAKPIWEAEELHPLQLTGVVTWVDQPRRLVVVEDSTGAVGLFVNQLPEWLHVGQRVDVGMPDSQPYFAALPDFPRRPTVRRYIENFEIPVNTGEHYVSRVRGYIRPPRTGVYSFWIASDDTAELWLSDGERVERAKRIAAVGTWTKSRDWGHASSQHSAPIRLEAGKRYFIEALHEQKDGDDNLSVAWDGPFLAQQVIGPEFLEAWVEPQPGTDPQSRAHAVGQSQPGRLTWELWQGAALDGTWKLKAGRKFESLLVAPDAVFTLHGPTAPPVPRHMFAEQAMSVDDNFRWSEIEGTVDFVSQEGDSLVLELIDGGSRVRAIVQQWHGDGPQRLKQRRVRLQGVAEAGLNAANEPILATLWAASPHAVSMLDAAPVPKQFRSATISELLHDRSGESPDQPVRITGEVVAGAGTRSLTVRDSGSFSGYISEDGATWKQLGPPVDIPMGKLVYVGLGVNSHSSNELSTAIFDHVGGLSALPLQVGIGPEPNDGDVEVKDGSYLVKGRGREMWWVPDQFHFVYEPLLGEGEIVARIVGFKSGDPRAKAGIMIRESLAENAQFVDLIHTQEAGASFQWRQRVEGVVPKSVTEPSVRFPYWLKLVRHNSTIAVTLNETPSVTTGQIVAITGHLASREGTSQIIDASCQLLPAETEHRDFPFWNRPLVDVAGLAAISSGASKLDVFRVRGVVTFSGEVEGHRYFALQDPTGGAFIHPPGERGAPMPRVGQSIEIHSNPGLHSPTSDIVADNILYFGSGIAPRPLQHPLEYLLPKQGEGSWIEIEGIVRSVSETGLMRVKQNGEIFSVYVDQAPLAKLAGWVDSLIRIRGVIAFPSEQERLLLVPAIGQIEVLEAGAPHPFELSTQSIGALTPVKLINQSRHRVKVIGTVTYKGPNFLYIQSGDAGARVDLSVASDVQPGEDIEVVGFPDPAEDKSLALSDAELRSRHVRSETSPLRVDAREIFGGKTGGKLVRFNATVVANGRAANRDHTLELQLGQEVLRASLGDPNQPPPSIPVGSMVEVTGVSVAKRGFMSGIGEPADDSPNPTIRLLLRSTADIVVLQKPRWWVVKRTLLITSGLSFAFMITTWWIETLRRRVSRRTAELAKATTELKQETQLAATLAERDRLAGEIHDSLSQSFTALLLQLDSTAKLSSCTPEVQAGLTLARRMVAFSRTEVHNAVWDLQSPLLSDSELHEAVKKIVGQITLDTLQAHVKIEGTPYRLSSAMEHHLLRVAQEAINNTVKHAAAHNLEVVLRYTKNMVTLTLADDGCGFVLDKALAANIGQFGLRSLRGRANKIGAVIEIVSTPKNGTIIEVRVPTQTA